MFVKWGGEEMRQMVREKTGGKKRKDKRREREVKKEKERLSDY